MPSWLCSQAGEGVKMSTNILDNFPGLTYNDVRVVPYEAAFNAVLGAVTPGIYSWLPGSNGDSFAHDAWKGHYYYIDSYSVVANIDQLEFSNALNTTFQDGFFNFSVFKFFENRPANPSLIKFASFRQDSPLALSYGTQKLWPTPTNPTVGTPEQIYFRVSGQLLQTPQLTTDGITSITIYINAAIYEILNQDWIAKWFLSSARTAKKGGVLDG